MSVYLISYDINEKNKEEYQPLWDKLAEMQAVKILYSEYLVVGRPFHHIEIYEQLSPLIRSNDRLLVQEVVQNSAWDRLLISDEEFRAILKSARQ